MLGGRLKKLRNSKKITQEELGKKVNVTKVSISGYENGNRSPDTDTLQKIADFFDVSTDYLLGRSDNPELNDSIDQKDKSFFTSKIATEFPDIDLMFKDMESLTAEQMEEVYEYIKFKMSQKKEDNK